MKYLFLILMVFAGTASADFFDSYKAQNSSAPFSWVEVSGNAVLTWQREIIEDGNYREICLFEPYKNTVATDEKIVAIPYWNTGTLTVTWTDTDFESGDTYTIGLISCAQHRHKDFVS